MTHPIEWEHRLTTKLSNLSAALDFLDVCRIPENIEQAKETGALKDAHEQLESSARQLVKFIKPLKSY